MAATRGRTRGWGWLAAAAVATVAAGVALPGGRVERVTVRAAGPAVPRPEARAAVRRPPEGGRPGEDTSPGRYRETPDAGNYVIHPRRPGSPAGAATSVTRGPERLRFSVSVDGDDAAGTVSAELTNTSGREMRFVEGLRVVAAVTLDGRPWREFVLSDPAVTSLAPGQETSLQTSFAFDGPGQYSTWGSVEIELV